ncbi:MAG: hypothetical protein JW969_14565 [Spirochaetales bacterium]|nr:hypothetical protein [Spirochaetales bacterium]
MRGIIPFILLFLLLITGCGVTKKEAIAYDSRLIHMQNKITRELVILGSLLRSGNFTGIEDRRAALSKSVDLALEELKSIGPFDSDSRYRDALVSLLTFYATIANTEYLEVIAILKQSSEGASDQDLKKLNEISERILKSERELYEELADAQKVFEDKYRIIQTGAENLP